MLKLVNHTKQTTVLFVSALCVTVILFSLPTILFYITLYTDFWNHFSRESTNINKNLSTIDTTSDRMIPSCDSVVSQSINDIQSMVCEPYLGGICSSYLIEWQQLCLSGGNEPCIVVKKGAETQEDLERQIKEFQQILSRSFPECHALIMPYLCLHSFPLSDCQTSSCTAITSPQSYYTISQEKCIDIQNNAACAIPLMLEATIDLEYSLPDCSLLPLKNVSNGVSYDSFMKMSNLTSATSALSNITCKDDFMLINRTCFPRCDKFEDYSHETTQARQISVIIASTIAAMFSVTGLILSLFNRKIMFKFPSIFLVFFLMDVFIAALMPLIIAMDTNRLICSSVNLVETFRNPTMACLLSGAIFHYAFINLAMWWFFHMSYFFYEIKFPFHANRTRKLPHRIKPLAVTLIITGCTVPLPSVIFSLSSKSNGYNLVSMPPLGCMPDANVWFYSTTLVLSFVLGTGVCLLISVFWIIHKNKISRLSTQQNKKQKLTTSEKKLIGALLSYIVFGTYALIFFGISHGDTDRALRELKEYFICELTGHVPDKCDRSRFERHLYPRMSVIAYIFLGVIPMSIIIFIVDWHKLWRTITKSTVSIWSSTIVSASTTDSLSTVTNNTSGDKP